MIGDSITEQMLREQLRSRCGPSTHAFPSWKLTFRGVGIGGDRSPGGNSRFKRDVVRFKPTALTVDFGMNDGGYGEFKQPLFDTYFKGLQGMADQAKEAKIRVAWVTPQPLDTPDAGKTEPNKYNPDSWRSSPKMASSKSPRKTMGFSSIITTPIWRCSTRPAVRWIHTSCHHREVTRFTPALRDSPSWPPASSRG